MPARLDANRSWTGIIAAWPNNFRHQSLLPAGLLLFIFGAWLANNPYIGIVHDSTLYTAQALSHLYPESFSKDLFFQYGSQDNFTIFSRIHAVFINFLGVQAASQVLVLTGKIFWFCSLIFLLKSYLHGTALWIGLLAITTLGTAYDGGNVFTYGESFVTSRIFAEACAMLALAMFARRQILSSICLAAAAMLLHPLMAIPAICLLLMLHLIQSPRKNRALFLQGVALILLLILAAIGIHPIDRLLMTYDPVWLSIIQARNPLVFPEHWARHGLPEILLTASLLAATYLTQTGKIAELARAALITMVLLLAVSWAGTTFIHDILLTQLQLWRVLWLAQLLALALCGHLFVNLQKGHDKELLLLCALATALLLKYMPVGFLAASGLIIYLLLQKFKPDWRATLATRIVLIGLITLALCYQLILIPITVRVWDAAEWPIMVPLLFNLPAQAVVVGLVLLALKSHPKVAAVVLPLCMAGFIVGLLQFNQEKPDEPSIDPATIQQLQTIIPRDAVVYKPGGLKQVWLQLHRANYASPTQTAGLLFSREAAIEARRRQTLLRSVGLKDGIPYWSLLPEARAMVILLTPGPSDEAIRILCLDPVLDYIILNDVQPNDDLVTASEVFRNNQLSVYSCQKIRHTAAAPASRPSIRDGAP